MSGTSISAQLALSTDTVSPGGRFDYTVLNTSRRTISFGLPYRLEQLHDDVWREVPVERAFRLPLYSLAPGRARALRADVPQRAAPGRYRLVKEIREYPPRPSRRDPPQQRIEVSCEFEVSGGAGREPGKLV